MAHRHLLIATIAALCIFSLAKAENEENDMDLDESNELKPTRQPGLDKGEEITGLTEIYEPPYSNIYVQVGRNFTLECRQKEGKPINWFQDTTLINEDAGSGFVSYSKMVYDQGKKITISTLTKLKTNLSDATNYQCRPEDQSDAGYWVTVHVVQIIPKDSVLDYGKTAELQCLLTGATSYNQLRWYRGENELKEEQVEEGQEPKYVIHYANKTLEIHHATELDMGQYECVFELDNNEKFRQTVNLNAEPYVKKFEPKSKNLVQGDPMELHCKAFGYPLPTVTWLKEEDPIFWDTERVTLDIFNEVENASLRIEEMDFPDRANYVCIASNKYGTHNSTVLVRVKDKLAALWPFLGICAEVIILCAIIFIYEKRRAKKMEAEDTPEEAGHLTNSNDHKGKDDIRQRK